MDVVEKTKRALNKRIFPGFKIGEALLFFAFHAIWPAILGGLYYLGGVFRNNQNLTLEKFVLIQFFVVIAKAICLVPFWWLIFIALKKLQLVYKIVLHFLNSALYGCMVLAIVYFAKTVILKDTYAQGAMLSDFYFLLISYFSYFALFHAYDFWLHTKAQLKKEHELKELAYQSEIKALKAQIEPHFLFNTLNSISASVPPELEKTRVLISKLADTFRYALHASERPVVSLEEELLFIQTWLALEKHRFGNRLHIEFSIDNPVLSTPIPPMLLQPLVENAIKHGISPKIEGGTVMISCKKEPGFVRVIVSDSGVGYSKELTTLFNTGFGLKNIQQRLDKLYREQLQVDRNEHGLTFSFKIPITAN
jgi:two-component system, LytTR family, sensor kinase